MTVPRHAERGSVATSSSAIRSCSIVGMHGRECSTPEVSSRRSACSPPSRSSRAPSRVPAGSGSRTGRRSIGSLAEAYARAGRTTAAASPCWAARASSPLDHPSSHSPTTPSRAGTQSREAYSLCGRAGRSRSHSERADDEVELSVFVEEYLPRLAARLGAPRWTGALYAKGQSPLHAAVSRRYFELLASRAGV